MSKNYYNILGVTEFDNTDKIKAAYRQLARKFHPDIAGNSPDAILRFKEINEAYEILSNKIKREEYDKALKFYNYAKNNSSNSYKTTSNASKPNEKEKNFSFKWEDLIYKKNQEKYSKNTQQNSPINGKDIYSEIEITIFEALCGTTKVINILQTEVCNYCNGKKFANGSFCTHCNGKGETSSYKKFHVKIPAEIKDKSKIRLANEGEKGHFGGKNGDLYLIVRIKDNIDYTLDGNNILKKISISPIEAILGKEIKVQVKNETYSIKLAPYTQNGQKIRLNECGLMQNDKIGDMILTIEIKIPKNLSEEELALYKKLDEISKKNN